MAWTSTGYVLGAWIGDDAPSDTDLLAVWIDRAERLIRFNVPGIQARIDMLEVDLLDNVRDVVTSMVTRKFRNPEGIRSTSVATGPFSESRTFGGDDPGEMLILDSELALISGNTSGGQRAYTVDTIPTSSPFSSTHVPSGWPFSG